jgi:hypothetical protein
MKIFGIHIGGKPKPSLRVRVTERSDELKERLLNKELEHIDMVNEMNAIREQRNYLETWLRDEAEERQRKIGELHSELTGHTADIVDLRHVDVPEGFKQT